MSETAEVFKALPLPAQAPVPPPRQHTAGEALFGGPLADAQITAVATALLAPYPRPAEGWGCPEQ